jgi:hypothetical protein
MSYDLAVWEGARPESDEAAGEAYVRLMDQLEERVLSGAPGEAPSPRIQAYVDALVERWPEDDDDAPWATSPLITEASGEAIYFPIVLSRGDEVSAYAAQVAAEHGLVCYDPQLERLRPEQSVARRKWWSRRDR